MGLSLSVTAPPSTLTHSNDSGIAIDQKCTFRSAASTPNKRMGWSSGRISNGYVRVHQLPFSQIGTSAYLLVDCLIVEFATRKFSDPLYDPPPIVNIRDNNLTLLESCFEATTRHAGATQLSVQDSKAPTRRRLRPFGDLWPERAQDLETPKPLA